MFFDINMLYLIFNNNNMNKYKWERNGYEFLLEYSNSEPLWGNEGISQLVKLIVIEGEYINTLISTNLGTEYVLEIMQRDIKNNLKVDRDNNPNDFHFHRNTFYFLVDDFGEYQILEDGDCVDFYDWFVQSLSVIEGRKMKIKKIREKING